MKIMATRTFQKAADLGDIPPVVMDVDTDWQARYNALAKENLRLAKENEQLKHPPRTQAELEDDWRAVLAFLDSMPLAAGAVTCAGVYSVAFLQQQELAFVVKLCTELVSRYAAHQALIQSTYDTWTHYAK